MLSDEEKDNVFKISVPIFTNEELKRFEYSLETDLDNIVNEISTHISRDREIILLKKVIEKQQKEIEELKYKVKEHICIEAQEQVKQLYVPKDKIKAKIEEFKKVRDTILENEKELNRPMMTYDLKRNDYCEKMLQSLLEKE